MVNQNLLFFDKQGEQYNFEWNGDYWEGSVLFPLVSEKLFEIEHIFVIEKFLNNLSETKYGFPHSYGVSPGSPVWRTRWESDYDGTTDISSIIYTYELGVDTTLDAPVLVKAKNVELLVHKFNTIIIYSIKQKFFLKIYYKYIYEQRPTNPTYGHYSGIKGCHNRCNNYARIIYNKLYRI